MRLNTQAYRGSRRSAHLPVPPWKGLNYTLSQLLPEGTASNQPASRCWVTLPFGTLEGLGTPSTSRSHWGQRRAMGSHKSLRDDQEHGPGWLMRFISYTRLCLSGMEGVSVLPSGQKPAQSQEKWRNRDQQQKNKINIQKTGTEISDFFFYIENSK